MRQLSSYRYDSASRNAHGYLWPALQREIERRSWPTRRAFDLGCGNGATANMLSQMGFTIVGVDPSGQGIVHAKAVYPHLRCEQGSAYDPLVETYGTFLFW